MSRSPQPSGKAAWRPAQLRLDVLTGASVGACTSTGPLLLDKQSKQEIVQFWERRGLTGLWQ
jgi:hypothetical protein